MTLHQFHLVCFAAGSVIHGTQTVLVWRLRKNSAAPRSETTEGIVICTAAFFWLFGNLWRELAITFGYQENTAAFEIGLTIHRLALFSFPLLFSYTIAGICSDSPTARVLIKIGTWLRYPMLIFVPASAASVVVGYVRKPQLLDPELTTSITLYVMFFYFLLFFAVGAINARGLRSAGRPPLIRANRAGTVAAFVAFGTFFIMLSLPGDVSRINGWIALAAMMTSVPFTVALAYRQYQFPFMDAFLRDVITGVILLAIFCVAFTSGFRSSDMFALWMAVVAISLAFARAPISRWVERQFLGYAESLEDQEERIAKAIRGLTQFSELGPRVSELLAAEIQADWISIGPDRRSEAVAEFEIPGATPMWIALGPRHGSRSYMSRQLQVARRAALELTAQRHLLQEHELRDSAARAQMRALQAQINPHFLFNTLNVLANLIHTNPAAAERVTEDLAGIFRYALDSTRLEWVHLDDELRFLQAYLEIEQTRFEERLTFSFEIEPSLRSIQIPPMILQPLVENAVRHGIAPKVEGGAVRITAQSRSGRATITIEDSGAGVNGAGHRGSGIGLANVRERLSHVYGEGATLRLDTASTNGTRAVLDLPL